MKIQNLYIFSLCLLLLFCCQSEPEPPLSLEVSTNEIVVNAETHSKMIHVESNSSWTVNNSNSWIKISFSQGEGSMELIIQIEENSDEMEREGVVRISNSAISRSITIKQEGVANEFPSYYISPDPSGMRDISSLELASDMARGWNLGNSLEAIGGETAWGNPVVTEELILAVKAAGFKSVRIPVAWSKFSNPSDYSIDPLWMARVQEVVDYCIDNDLYVLLNIHWDGGWMQPTYEAQDEVNERLKKMWIQIALNFRDYDDHLLFAGTNEVMVEGDYSAPTTEYYTVQNSFNQTFVEAVRNTGGRNSFRNLVVQTFNTNIDYGINYFQLPEDTVEDRLMVEVHYYDPYEFALKEDGVSEWGKDSDPAKSATWGNEDYVDTQFEKLKSKFIDQGIPVLVGEFGAISRLNQPNHATFRKYYLDYITQQMVQNQLVPFYWDNGFSGNHGFAIFDRTNYDVLYPELLEVLLK